MLELENVYSRKLNTREFTIRVHVLYIDRYLFGQNCQAVQILMAIKSYTDYFLLLLNVRCSYLLPTYC